MAYYNIEEVNKRIVNCRAISCSVLSFIFSYMPNRAGNVT